jgi:hypothetical protein
MNKSTMHGLGYGTTKEKFTYRNVLFSQNSICIYMNCISLQCGATAESFFSSQSVSDCKHDVTTSSFSNKIPSEEVEQGLKNYQLTDAKHLDLAKMNEINEQFRILHNGELCGLYRSPNSKF